MDSNPMLPLTVLVLLLMMSSTFSSSSSPGFPVAKPGCPDHCGNVSIPYPFGVGEACYLNDRFSIQCNDSSNASTPTTVLRAVFNVTDISLEGQLRILQYIAYDCYDRITLSENNNSPYISVGMPMTFNSTANKFTVIGCDTYSYAQGISGKRNYTTGCMTICDSTEDVESGSCSGLGCCQTSIPPRASNISVTLGSYYNHSYVSSFNPCSYAFVVANDAFEFSVDNFTNLANTVSLPIVLDWVVANETCDVAQKNLSSYACGKNSRCYVEKGTLGYRCRCEEGYEGNPYLPNGCQDIDECKNPDLCPNYSTCHNTMGGHQCNCSKGYHDDLKGGCVEDRNYWPIFAGVGVITSTAILATLSVSIINGYHPLEQIM